MSTRLSADVDGYSDDSWYRWVRDLADNLAWTGDGGSFHDRMGRVECWNSVMDENRYMVRKWNEFIAS